MFRLVVLPCFDIRRSNSFHTYVHVRMFNSLSLLLIVCIKFSDFEQVKFNFFFLKRTDTTY